MKEKYLIKILDAIAWIGGFSFFIYAILKIIVKSIQLIYKVVNL